ncbi:MAG: hypothetical protein PQ612_06695 [Rickettsiales bacterium]|nr:hypothetical protein [Pseudomonadota bacterium]MDA0966662.1 hypothetical protein [Pseudomonadota bacterium]MDG4543690.1 hypothetical protein [Rickettsiales bacterium]MDG4545837.1 hypothetical protein [Rickettsiales bacterium]MDG4547389.1 hypothetical protein [Rickettsiales bacterium]
MSANRTIVENKIDEFANEIKKQFEEIGNEVKEQLLKDFDKILTNDLEGLKNILSKAVMSKSQDILKNSSNEFQDIINKDFNGTIFGSILADAILPNITNTNNSSASPSRDFNPSSAQRFLDMAKALAKSQSRNG